MFAWLSTLKGDLRGKSHTERSYREDGKLSCPDAGQSGSTLLSGCRWRACLVVPLFGSKHALVLNRAFSFVIASWLRYWLLLSVVALCCCG